MLFISLDNNDVCHQNDTGAYLSTGDAQVLTGYSGGAQERWLEKTLKQASTDTTVDWIVAYMHQPAMSTSNADGSDLSIRQSWMPLFYKYGVDFVLAGHDHDYERSYLVHGTDSGTALRPSVVSTDLTSIDTDKGLVHMVVGTVGTKGDDDYATGASGEPVEVINTSPTESQTEDAPWTGRPVRWRSRPAVPARRVRAGAARWRFDSSLSPSRCCEPPSMIRCLARSDRAERLASYRTGGVSGNYRLAQSLVDGVLHVCHRPPGMHI